MEGMQMKKVLTAVLPELEKDNIPFALMGALAFAFWGHRRYMEMIAQSRRDRKLRESFTSYLEFLESSAAVFGLGKRRPREKFSPESPDLLL